MEGILGEAILLISGSVRPQINNQPHVCTQQPPVGIQPPPVGAQPPPVGAQPPPVGTQPPPVSAQPPPVGAQPPPVGIQPPPVGAQPPSVGAQPPPVGTQPPPVSAQPPQANQSRDRQLSLLQTAPVLVRTVQAAPLPPLLSLTHANSLVLIADSLQQICSVPPPAYFRVRIVRIVPTTNRHLFQFHISYEKLEERCL